jgi:hypothetical protein
MTSPIDNSWIHQQSGIQGNPLWSLCTEVKDKPFNHSRLSKSGPSALSHMGTKNVNNVSVDSNRKE